MTHQPDGPSNNAWGVDLCDPVMVSHQSRLVLMARERGAPTGTLYFQVLDPSDASAGDDFNAWNGWYRYRFPEAVVDSFPQNAVEMGQGADRELRLAGMDLLTVSPIAQAVVPADAAFRLVSDGTYLSVFRVSAGGTLLLNRLAVIARKEDVDGEEVQRFLIQAAWEVRFQRSGLRDVPMDDLDSQGFLDPVGDPFLEPAHEFAQVKSIVGSAYGVARIPTVNPDVFVLYVAVVNGAGVQLHQVRQSGGTLSDWTETAVSYPLLCPTLRGGGTPLAPLSGLAPCMAYYAEQESSSTEDGKGAELQRAGHLMLGIPVSGGGLGSAFVIYDFALDRDGNIPVVPAAAQSVVLVDGTIVNGAFVPDMSSPIYPTLTTLASTVQMLDGLLVSSMVLGQLQPDARSGVTLQTGDDGLVHAYFGGPQPVPPFDRWSSLDPTLPQAMVAQFDARANRLILSVPWSIPVPEVQPNGHVDFVALQSGSLMDGVQVVVADGTLAHGGPVFSDLCNLSITYPSATGLPSETWRGVPRELVAFMDVLNGRGSDDSADPRVLSSARPFFDFSGTLAQARIPLTFPAGTVDGPSPAVTFISTKPDIALAAVVTSGNGGAQDYILTFSGPNGVTITLHWQSVPVDVRSLRDVFEGAAAVATYGYPADSNGTPLFALNTDARGVDAPVLLFSKGTNPNAGGLTIAVQTNALDATRVDVIVTSGGTPSTIPALPAAVDDFVTALLGNATFQTFGLGVSGTTVGGNVRPAVAAGRLNLAETSVLFDLLLPDVDLILAAVPNQTFTAGTQVHTYTPNGSYDVTRMVGLLARSLAPTAGAAAFVQNSAVGTSGRRLSRSLHSQAAGDPLLSGVWIRTVPQVQCTFGSTDSVQVPVVQNGLPVPVSLNLRPQWDWTLELWVRPQSGTLQRILTFADLTTTVPGGNPALNYALSVEGQEVLTASSYQKTPGLPDSSYFQTGTSAAAPFMPVGEFTWEVWIQPETVAGPPASGGITPLGGLIQVGQGNSNAFLTVGLTAARFIQIVAVDNNSNPIAYTSSEAVDALEDGLPVWSHIAVVGIQDPVSKNWSLKLYLDAEVVGNFTGVVIQVQSAAYLIIGANTPNNASMYGSMAQLRYWSIARSLADIRRTWLVSLSGSEPGLLGNWPLSAIEPGGPRGCFVRNTAAITNQDWDANQYVYKQPLATNQDSFFLSVLTSVAGMSSVEAEALLANGRWNHIALRYEAGGALEMNTAARQAAGVVDWVNCGRADSLGPSSNFAIDAYVQVPTTSMGLVGTILGRWAPTEAPDDQCYFWWIDSDGEMNFSIAIVVDDVGAIETRSAKSSGAALRDGVVHHLAVVFSTTSVPDKDPSAIWTLSFYKDGVSVGSKSETIDGISAINVRSSQNDVTLGVAFGPIEGAEPMASEEYYPLRARLGTVCYWSTDAALSALFPENYPRIPTVGSPRGLAAQWLFREQEGRVAFDQVAGNDAKLSNSAMWSSLAATSRLSVVANGALVGSVAPAANPLVPVTQSQFTMGAPIGTPVIAGLIGDLAQVCLYDQVRSVETIQDQMYVPREGNESGLIAAWNFSSGGVDITGGQNNASPPIAAGRLVRSTAPISDEGPFVRNVYGGWVTDQSQSAPGPIAVGSYADAQDVGTLRQRAVLKRQYVLDANQTRARAIQIGELGLTYIGQVQTDPTLIGYIEGAPPVPSENLTRPYYLEPSNASYMKYLDTSKVTLVQEATENLSFGTSSAHATQIQAGFALGLFGVKDTGELGTGLGVFSIVSAYQMKTTAQLVFQGSGTIGGGNAEDLQAAYGATQRDTMGHSGDWENFQADPSRYLNPVVGRRFTPDNLGYALVESLTADLYAITYGPTNAALGTLIIPNPAIPPDRNILLFPIRNDYTKAGTLDGKIGLVNDPSFKTADVVRGSYFRPIEAYAMAAEIDQARQRALSVETQFDVGSRASSWNTDLTDAKAAQSQDFSETPKDPVAVATPIQGLVNRYVWTADGGFHAEEQGTAATSSKSYSGAVSRGGGAGIHAEGEFFAKIGFSWGLDVMASHQVDVTVTKSKSSTQALSMNVSVDGEAFLRAYDPGVSADYGGGKGAFLPGAAPGKVKSYRFMSFYLPPSSRNSADFEKIVDPVWRLLSNDPNARAMREIDLSSPTWRVLHRVTYVERVPPPIASRPLYTASNDVPVPSNVQGNAELIRLVVAQIPAGVTARTRLVIGNAVAVAMNPAPTAPGHYNASALEAIVPWWRAFLDRARPDSQGGIQDPAAAALLNSLVGRTTRYIHDGFATDSFQEILGG
jgi:hypothetical protein